MNQVLPLSKFTCIVSLLVLFLPHSASAAVQITEIMYDASGTDTGHEWVEVTNTGSSPEDISTYKFFEDNSNHSITVLSGVSVLSAGMSAVIVTDQAKFSADWPTYSGSLLKSSFSLSNTGETISLKDSTLTVVDTAVYDSSMGAAGDGNSLARSGTSFTAGSPTLGSYAGAAPPSLSSSSQTPPRELNSGQTQQVSAGAAGPATLLVDIDAESYVLVGGGEFFTGSAWDAGGLKTRARYVWNFGDGTTEEGQTVFHAYTYPGTYVVQLSAGFGVQAGIGRMTVEVAPPQVGLVVGADGSVAIMNQATRELNVGLWSITSGGATFVIPENTVLLAHGSIRFAPSVMRMLAQDDATLRYPNNSLATTAIPRVHEPAQKQSSVPTSEVGIPTESVEASAPARPAGGSAPPVVIAPSSTPPSMTLAATSATGVSLPTWSYVLGAVGLGLLGIGGVSYMGLPRRKVTNTDADEFEVE